jgi:hypothetical protein
MRRYWPVIVAVTVLLGALTPVVVHVLRNAQPMVTEPNAHQHEILSDRPSGFWTSNRPAVGGAYRWRLLGLGVAITLGMGLVTWRLLRRASSQRVGNLPRGVSKS